MKISAFFTLVGLIMFLNSSGQDTIFLKTGLFVPAKVLTISDSEIRYKESSNPEGPDYILKKYLVDRIRFRNGDIKDFGPVVQAIAFGDHIISYHIVDILYRNFAFSYEQVLKDGTVGLRIPIVIGFNNHEDRDGPFNYTEIGYTGAALNYYIPAKSKVSYFVGPEFDLGIGRYFDYVSSFPPENRKVPIDFVYGKLYINNGISISPTGDFRLMAMTGLGIRYFDLNEDNEGGFNTAVYFTFAMGYRF